jgi:hypothetical protein
MKIKVKVEAYSFIHSEEEVVNSVRVKVIPLEGSNLNGMSIPHDSRELPLDSLIYSSVLHVLSFYKTLNAGVEIEDIELELTATHANFDNSDEAEPIDKSESYLNKLKIAIDIMKKVRI